MYGNNICRENTNVYLKRGPVSFQHLRWKLELTSLYSDTVSMNYLNWLSKMRKLWSSCILNFSFWTQFCILKNLKKNSIICWLQMPTFNNDSVGVDSVWRGKRISEERRNYWICKCVCFTHSYCSRKLAFFRLNTTNKFILPR